MSWRVWPMRAGADTWMLLQERRLNLTSDKQGQKLHIHHLWARHVSILNWFICLIVDISACFIYWQQEGDRKGGIKSFTQCFTYTFYKSLSIVSQQQRNNNMQWRLCVNIPKRCLPPAVMSFIVCVLEASSGVLDTRLAPNQLWCHKILLLHSRLRWTIKVSPGIGYFSSSVVSTLCSDIILKCANRTSQ